MRTARARYHIRGSHVGCELLPHPAAVIVCIENASPERLTSTEVGSLHRLTAREIEVALLLAEGRSNAQVARMLGFTIHTARRHAEHILLKLELHSRAEVGPKLYGRSGSSSSSSPSAILGPSLERQGKAAQDPPPDDRPTEDLIPFLIQQVGSDGVDAKHRTDLIAEARVDGLAGGNPAGEDP